MGNRKERRATKKPQSANDLTLAQPDRSAPSAQTLYDLAAERELELGGGRAFTSSSGSNGPKPQLITKIINPDGTVSTDDSAEASSDLESTEDPIGPLGDALLYAFGLTMLHMTLEVLVHQQYAEMIRWNIVARQTFKTFPMLLVLVYALHSRAKEVWAQGLFLGACMGAGCYLSSLTHEKAMFVVMKLAPSIGTIWVWSVLELRLEFAVLGLAVVGSYFWKQGYSIY